MTTNSPISGIPLPEDDDIINYNATYGGLARGVDTLLHPRFASTAARDAAVTVGAGRTPGMIASTANAPQMFFDNNSWDDYGAWTYIRKVTTESRNASGAAIAADATLTFSAAASSRYEVEAFMVFQGGGAGASNVGASANFLLAGARTVDHVAVGMSAADSNATNYQMTARLIPAATDAVFGMLGGGGATTARMRATFTTTSAAALTLYWGANNTVAGGTCSLFQSSYLRWRRLP